MFSLKNNKDKDFFLDYENCIFSLSNSRPSKTLLDCNLFKQYSKINLNLDILDEFSYVNILYKNKDYLLINTITLFTKLP